MISQGPQFSAGQLNVSHPARVSDVSKALRHTGRRVMLVPTMGALHQGHLALVRAAKRVPGAVVVVSIFVNPLQSGANEDLNAYPRTLDADLELLAAEGVEVVFTPTGAVMYPAGPHHRPSRSARVGTGRFRSPNAFRGHADGGTGNCCRSFDRTARSSARRTTSNSC